MYAIASEVENIMLSKFLDPKNDYAFKQIFGTEKNQDILIHFINDILCFKGPEQVVSVEFLKTSQDPEIASQKQSTIDVLCKDERGRKFIIEMQVARMQGFEKRAQYYASKAYSRQLIAGDNYTELKEIIFIAITDFVMFKDKASGYSTHVILDNETHAHHLKDFSFTFLELPKFNKKIDELDNLIEKWAYFFKHAEETKEADLQRIVGSDPVMYRAYEALNRFSWTEIELNTYEQAEKRERDAQAIIQQKLIDAEAKGEARGEAKGKAKGIVEGEARGETKGIARTLEAITLIKAGESDATISEKLGLALEVIEALRNQIMR
jgi:predicted transposase/invertase (TIGR01784 family)